METNINVMVADQRHTRYAEEICQEIYISSLERKTGIAKRTPEYIIQKMESKSTFGGYGRMYN